MDLETILQIQAAAVWERGVSRFGKYCFIWNEYVTWARSSGDFPLCRGVFQRGIKAVKDCPEELCKAYVTFESQVGSLADLTVAIQKTKSIIKNAEVKAAKLATVAAVNEGVLFSSGSGESEGGSTKSLTGRISGPNGRTGDKETVRKSINVISRDKQSNLEGNGGGKRSLDATPSTSHNSNGVVINQEIEEVQPENKRRKVSFVENNSINSGFIGEASSSSADKVSSKVVVVKNLSFSSTEDEIRSHFATCGAIEQVRLLLSKAGTSRGQAFVEFCNTDDDSASKALNMTGSTLGGRSIVVEAEAEGNRLSDSMGKKSETSHHPTTVFVSKLSDHVTNDILRSMFESCGIVVEARVVLDKKTNNSKVT